MKLKLNINKKILIVIVVFIVFFIVISIVYLIFNPANNNQSKANPGGTGGDYSLPNNIDISNNGVLYNSLGSEATDSVMDGINNAVLYNISLSNDPNATSDYILLDSLSYTPRELYKDNTSYVVKIDNDQINTVYRSPDYWFTLSTNDGRHFRVDEKTNDSDDQFLYIKKTN